MPLGIDTVILFFAGFGFSLLLYGGDYVPWWLSTLAGFLSFLFLTVLGLNWINGSNIPEAGWLFILWGVVNLLLSIVIMIMSIRSGNKGRFEERGRFDTS